MNIVFRSDRYISKYFDNIVVYWYLYIFASSNMTHSLVDPIGIILLCSWPCKALKLPKGYGWWHTTKTIDRYESSDYTDRGGVTMASSVSFPSDTVVVHERL